MQIYQKEKRADLLPISDQISMHLEVLNETVIQMDLKLGLDIFLGIDIGASYFFKKTDIT